MASRIINEFMKQRRTEKAYKEHLHGLSADALAEEHAKRLKRIRALSEAGASADPELIKEIKYELKALADEIRTRATQGQMHIRASRRAYLYGKKPVQTEAQGVNK